MRDLLRNKSPRIFFLSFSFACCPCESEHVFVLLHPRCQVLFFFSSFLRRFIFGFNHHHRACQAIGQDSQLCRWGNEGGVFKKLLHGSWQSVLAVVDIGSIEGGHWAMWKSEGGSRYSSEGNREKLNCSGIKLNKCHPGGYGSVDCGEAFRT